MVKFQQVPTEHRRVLNETFTFAHMDFVSLCMVSEWKICFFSSERYNLIRKLHLCSHCMHLCDAITLKFHVILCVLSSICGIGTSVNLLRLCLLTFTIDFFSSSLSANSSMLKVVLSVSTASSIVSAS